MLEALIGQIFLVVMVSRLVALLTPTQRGARRAGTDDDLTGPGRAGDRARDGSDDGGDEGSGADGLDDVPG